jgi:hypothetical protein
VDDVRELLDDVVDTRLAYDEGRHVMRNKASAKPGTKKGKKASRMKDLSVRKGKNELAAAIRGGAADIFASRRSK